MNKRETNNRPLTTVRNGGGTAPITMKTLLKRNTKRILSLLLTLCMVVSLFAGLGITAMATGEPVRIGTDLYATLGAAVTAAQPGDTITMVDDDSTSQKITISKSLSIELNGHDLSHTVFKIDAGTVSISDSVGTGTINSGNLTGIAIAEGSVSCNASFYVTGEASVTINNLRISECGGNGQGYNGYDLVKAIFLGGRASLTINGGAYTTKHESGRDAVFFYNNSGARLTINDGYFDGNCGLSVNSAPTTGESGTLQIRKAQFEGNGTAFWIEGSGSVNTKADAEKFINPDKSEIKQDEVFNKAKITIVSKELFVSGGLTGGEYGGTNSEAPAEVTLEESGSVELRPQILGGSGGALSYQWNKDEKAIVGATQATYTAKELGNYSVTVTENSTDNKLTVYWAVTAPASIEAKWGDSASSLTEFGTLQMAVKAANDSSTSIYIQLQSTVTLNAPANISFTSGDTTLDLNGKTLNGGISVDGSTDATHLTINDTASGGAVTGKSSSGYGAINLCAKTDDDSLTINGGTFTGNEAAAVAVGAPDATVNVTITGGTFQGADGKYALDFSGGVNAQISGGTFTGGGTEKAAYFGNCDYLEDDYTLSGGTFTGGMNSYCPLSPLLSDGYAFFKGDTIVTLAEETEISDTVTVGLVPVPGINVTGDGFASNYGATAAKTFSIALTGGLTGQPTVAWCDRADVTDGTPASAGTFGSVTGSDGSYSVTLTPSATASAGDYSFKVTVGEVSVIKTFTVNKISYNGAATATVKAYAGGSGSVTGSVFTDIAEATIKSINTLDTLNVLSANAALDSGTVSYSVKSAPSSGATDSYTVTLETTNYTDITATLVFEASAEDRTLKFNGTSLTLGDEEYPGRGTTWNVGTYTAGVNNYPCLELNNFSFTTTAATALSITGRDRAVKLTGTNSITSTFNGAENSYGIYYAVNGKLWFTGSGTLNATGGTSTSTENGMSCGIYAGCNYLYFYGCTVNATGGSALLSYGVQTNSQMTVDEGATVTGKATATGEKSYAFGIYEYGGINEGNLYVKDGTLIGEALNGTNKFGIAFDSLSQQSDPPRHIWGNTGSGYTVAGQASTGWSFRGVDAIVDSSKAAFAMAKISTYTCSTPIEIAAGAATTDKLENEGWKWDNEENTLTINGLNMNVNGSSGSEINAITLPADAKLEVEGTNTITVSSSGDRATASGIFGAGALEVSGEGSLTVTTTGTITDSALYASGNITIEDATLVLCGEGENSTGVLTTGNITINSGTVKADGKLCGIYATSNGEEDSGKIVINGGEVTASGGTQAISSQTSSDGGETITSSITTDGATIQTSTNSSGDGATEQENPNYATAKYVNISFNEASVTIGSETTHYAAFADALTAANNTAGSTLTLLKSVSGTTFNLGDKNMTLNLGAFTLTGQLEKAGGTLTVTGESGGKLTCGETKSTVRLTSGANLILNTVTVEQSAGEPVITTSYTNNTPVGGSITIHSGSVIQSVSSESNAITAAAGFTMTGGSITAASSYPAVVIFGGTANVSGGTITNTGGASALILAQSATATVSGSTSLSGSGAGTDCYAIKNYGTLILSGAPTLSGTAATLYTQDGASVRVGDYTGDAVTVFYGDNMQPGTQTAGTQSVGDVVISELTAEQTGKFTLVNPLRTISATLAYDDQAKTLSLGSPFGENASFTMTDAITGAGTITITGDMTLTDSFEVNTDISIDLNGHEVTGPSGKPAIVVNNGSALTIKDSGTDDKGALIGGSGQSSVSVKDGGSVTVNAGAAVTGGAGAAGITAVGTGSVTANGTVTGGNGDNATSGNGGSGVVTGSGNVTVDGTVTGGAGGNATSGNGGNGGNGVSTTSGTVTVNGTVSGGAGGNATSGNGGNGGNGVSTSGTVTGTGTVAGGNGGCIATDSEGAPGTGGEAIIGSTGGGEITTNNGKPGIKGVKVNVNIEDISGSTITVPPDKVIDAAVTKEEISEAEAENQSITVKLTVEASVNESGKTAIQNTISSENATIIYIEVKLEKVVTPSGGTAETTTITEANSLIPFDITLASGAQNKEHYAVLRQHGGSVDTLTETANNDGEYISVNAEKTSITVYAKKFSTYAIAYSDSNITTTQPTSPGGNTGSVGGTSNTAPAPQVNASANGAVALSPKAPNVGQTVTVTATPDKGYVVDTVTAVTSGGTAVIVTDAGNGRYTFKQTDQNVTVTVTFKPIAEITFKDVQVGDWFYEDVKYVFGKNLMSGISDEVFDPQGDTTRGMIVTILWRLENNPEAVKDMTFTDVQAGKYYTKAIAWAAENKIVEGYNALSFGADNPITREQLAAILYRYAKYKNYDVSASDDLTVFTDEGKISSFAKDAMGWTNASGLITGKSNSVLDPQGRAERCQSAAILHRFCENVVK